MSTKEYVELAAAEAVIHNQKAHANDRILPATSMPESDEQMRNDPEHLSHPTSQRSATCSPPFQADTAHRSSASQPFGNPGRVDKPTPATSERSRIPTRGSHGSVIRSKAGKTNIAHPCNRKPVITPPKDSSQVIDAFLVQHSICRQHAAGVACYHAA